MHNEEDSRWGEYSAACIRQIFASIPIPITRETKIFRSSTGEEEILLDLDRPDETPSGLYTGTEGWIDSREGPREKVVYRGYEWKRVESS
jgi:hypothetical protein